MDFKRISSHCGYFEAAVNIGYIHGNKKGLLIDAGLESAAAKKAIKYLTAESLPFTHLLITHAHADHYGGAHYLQEKYNVEIWAPPIEAAILENPILEPIYLFQGTNPVKELRNKFLEGQAIKVDHYLEEGSRIIDDIAITIHALPGHSYNQMGIEFNNILFAADAYFGVDQLKKHRIPYIVDIHQTVASLKKIQGMKLVGSIPGHGYFEKSFDDTIQANLDCHQQIYETLERFVVQNSSPSLEEIFQYLCREYEVHLAHPSSYLLFRTAIGAYIAGLIQEEKAEFEVKDYRLTVKATTRNAH